jgi:hypothetical protein
MVVGVTLYSLKSQSNDLLFENWERQMRQKKCARSQLEVSSVFYHCNRRTDYKKQVPRAEWVSMCVGQ